MSHNRESVQSIRTGLDFRDNTPSFRCPGKWEGDKKLLFNST